MIENQPPGQRPRLYGLYTGHPLTKRGVYGCGELPDRTTLYQDTAPHAAPPDRRGHP